MKTFALWLAVPWVACSLQAQATSETQAGAPGSANQPCASDDSRSISTRDLLPNILEDQRQIYAGFPAQLAHGRHWIPVVTVLGATAALVVLDQYDAPRLRQTSAFKGFNSALSGTNTSVGITLVPVSLYSAGLLGRDSYAQNTALFIGEAVADTEILGAFLKVATNRLRPLSVPVRGNFADTAFERGGYIQSSFPSGHALAAFSAATVMARRYGRHRLWVPVLAYGLAGAVGFSRMSLSAHFPSDVFMGAVLGYTVSRFVVLRE